jgi:GT2 family glycosyltransferase
LTPESSRNILHRNMQARSEVAVVIVSYNTRELTIECISSVIESARGSEVEIIVVDNGSKDGSSEAIKDSSPQIVLISNATNVGFGAACNQAINETRSPLILLLNSDARLSAEAFRALCEVMRARPSCGAAGCRLVDGQGVEMARTRNFLTPLNHALELIGVKLGFASRYLRRTCRPRLDQELLDCSIDWIDGACLMLRRRALDEVGLFDERFFMYSEDEDLLKRLKERGWTICFSAAGTALHHGARSSSQNRPAMLEEFYRSQMLFLFKHRGGMAVFFFMLATRAALSLKLMFKKARRADMSEHLRALKQAYSSKVWQSKSIPRDG